MSISIMYKRKSILLQNVDEIINKKRKLNIHYTVSKSIIK